MYYKSWLLLFGAFIFLITIHSRASHIRAGEITVKVKNCEKKEFAVTLTIYGNLNSPVKPGQGLLSFGDGESLLIPSGEFIPKSGLSSTVGVFEFLIDHLYKSNGTYLISYSEVNRNAGILNIENSESTPFYIETSFTASSLICNSSPILLAAPIDKACSKLSFYHNTAAFDRDGDSLSYILSIPKATKDQTVKYTSPIDSRFYGLNFNSGNEEQNGVPQFVIDSTDGTITWNAPGSIGEYNIAFLVEEWRKINGVYILIGSVRRDMQIIVEDCINQRPDLIIPEDICVYAGESITKAILGNDPDGQQIKIEAFSGIFSLSNNPAFVKPFPSNFLPSSSSIEFIWTPDCSNVRDQPYQVTFKITDSPSSGPALTKFKTWNIKVIAPPPVISGVDLDILKRETHIKWNPVLCVEGTKIIVWRRVGSFNFNSNQCATGLPKYAGYVKVAEVASNKTEFVDDNYGQGLDVGAVYCYRLTVIYPDIGNVESVVSNELCAPPIIADAPVITHVSVKTTSEQSGEIIISWRNPFELTNPDILKPYQYSLLRAKGQNGVEELTLLRPISVADTTYTDKGIDTNKSAYNYRIILSAKTISSNELISIDTSSVASSVWNSYIPLKNSIQLNWTSQTPWSNYDSQHPEHLIYRRGENTTDKDFVLIDIVNVFENGFTYVDKGTFSNEPLRESEFYYYRILTRGTYGNPSISSPLENLSQVIEAVILDDTPPCKPEFKNANNNCEIIDTLPCNEILFSNEFSWKEPGDIVCRNDIYRYNIYSASNNESEFSQVASVQDLEYQEGSLSDRSRCYKVASVDRAGNISEFSDPICFDNCPVVNFPNVFTPNEDDYNQYFAVMNDGFNCTRFVEKVRLRIYNQWGMKVVELNERDTIKWDGRDEHGNEVATGTYYFLANVTFKVNDPDIKYQLIKGWLQVMR